MHKSLWMSLLSLVLALTLWSHQAKGSDNPLPLEAYWQLVESAHDLAVSLQDAPADTASEALKHMAERWESVDAILLPDGNIQPVDNSFIIAQLRASPPDPERLEGLLNTLLEARQAWPEGRFTTQDIGALQEILERPEFQWKPATPSPWEKWLSELGNRLTEFLLRLFGGRKSGNLFALLRYVVIGIGILVAVLVLFYAFWRIWGTIATQVELPPDAQNGDEHLTANMALKKAWEISHSGDYRLAVRYLYLSALLTLEERELLRYDRSKTNREYLRSLAHLPELSATLRQVVDVFDRVWYGYQPLDEASFQEYAVHVTALGNGAPDRPSSWLPEQNGDSSSSSEASEDGQNGGVPQ